MTNSKSDVAIIGAGPYGLSLAAHLAARGIEHRVFGEPMETWKSNMPAGVLLKSYPWASCLSDPKNEFSIRTFSAARAEPYHDEMTPLPVERFVEYGNAFAARYVPSVERKRLISLSPSTYGFDAVFDGESVQAHRVVIAVGLHPFRRLPSEAGGLAPEAHSHSGDYGPLGGLDGKEVVVIGSGASATDLAALLHERGTGATLVARAPALRFAERPRCRSWFERVSAPMSGIGHGWTLGTCAAHPELIHLLPEHARVGLARAKALGPLGGAFMKDRVLGKVPLWLDHTVRAAELRGGKVVIDLADRSGGRRMLRADHVVFATGYQIDVGRLDFLSPEILGAIRLVEGAPRLTRHYESSVPGLHFIGPVSANSFGPVSRFVYGAYHPARVLTRHFAAALRGRVVPPLATRAISSTATLVNESQQTEVLS
jgi:thioredoxin reductase